MNVNLFTLIFLIYLGDHEITGTKDLPNSDGVVYRLINDLKNQQDTWEPSENLKIFTKFLETILHGGRKFLKKIRKIGHSHPGEIKFLKCFGNYVRTRIPWMEKRSDDLTQLSSKTTDYDQNSIMMEICQGKKEIYETCIVEPEDAFKLLKYFKKLIFSYLKRIFSNRLFKCFLEYCGKKFWKWIDSTPD